MHPAYIVVVIAIVVLIASFGPDLVVVATRLIKKAKRAPMTPDPWGTIAVCQAELWRWERQGHRITRKQRRILEPMLCTRSAATRERVCGAMCPNNDLPHQV